MALPSCILTESCTSSCRLDSPTTSPTSFDCRHRAHRSPVAPAAIPRQLAPRDRRLRSLRAVRRLRRMLQGGFSGTSGHVTRRGGMWIPSPQAPPRKHPAGRYLADRSGTAVAFPNLEGFAEKDWNVHLTKKRKETSHFIENYGRRHRTVCIIHFGFIFLITESGLPRADERKRTWRCLILRICLSSKLFSEQMNHCNYTCKELANKFYT